jgi:GT2 family glycosyltransferase
MTPDRPLVSIVICTHERHISIQRTLASLGKLSYQCFEVIVVDSSENNFTFKLIESMKKDSKFHLEVILSNKKNISISRNIGISNSSGEFILFIDDDAIPPADWVENLLLIYSIHGSKCAGVGGIVRDMTTAGYPLQYRYGITDIISHTIPIRSIDAANYNQANGFWYNSLMGANSSYRNEALQRIKGYDEFFEYFLDETDLCLRLIQAGYEIHYSNVVVDHYPAQSHNREDRKHLTCWYALAKNTTYFALKHALPKVPMPILVFRLILLISYRCLLRIIRLKFTHHLSNKLIWQYIKESIDGVHVGWIAGIDFHKHRT